MSGAVRSDGCYDRSTHLKRHPCRECESFASLHTLQRKAQLLGAFITDEKLLSS